MRQREFIALMSALVFSVTMASMAMAQPPKRRSPPCSGPEYRQFDFWIGDWEVKTPDGKLAGTNNITRPLGDCVLQEHWVGSQGGAGESYNIYDAVGGHWHQTWVDREGTYLALEGGLVGDAMVMKGPERVIQGKPTIDRITWTPKTKAEVHQVWDQSNDSGKTWTTVFHGVYRPRSSKP